MSAAAASAPRHLRGVAAVIRQSGHDLKSVDEVLRPFGGAFAQAGWMPEWAAIPARLNITANSGLRLPKAEELGEARNRYKGDRTDLDCTDLPCPDQLIQLRAANARKPARFWDTHRQSCRGAWRLRGLKW